MVSIRLLTIFFKITFDASEMTLQIKMVIHIEWQVVENVLLYQKIVVSGWWQTTNDNQLLLSFLEEVYELKTNCDIGLLTRGVFLQLRGGFKDVK